MAFSSTATADELGRTRGPTCRVFDNTRSFNSGASMVGGVASTASSVVDGAAASARMAERKDELLAQKA